LSYAQREAEELIAANRTVVLAIAAALAERSELSGAEIDGIISATLAKKMTVMDVPSSWGGIRNPSHIQTYVSGPYSNERRHFRPSTGRSCWFDLALRTVSRDLGDGEYSLTEPFWIRRTIAVAMVAAR